MGYDMGLGEINFESIEIVGERLANMTMDWEPAILRNSIGKRSSNSPIAEQFECIMKSFREIP